MTLCYPLPILQVACHSTAVQCAKTLPEQREIRLGLALSVSGAVTVKKISFLSWTCNILFPFCSVAVLSPCQTHHFALQSRFPSGRSISPFELLPAASTVFNELGESIRTLPVAMPTGPLESQFSHNA